MKVIAYKDNEIYEGQTPVIAKLVGKCSETLRRWRIGGKDKVKVNGYEIFFKIIDLKKPKPKTKKLK